MFHEHAAPVGDDPASGYKKKVGVRMFFVYGAFYVGFIAVNLIKPAVMERRLNSPGAPGTPPGASPASDDGGH